MISEMFSKIKRYRNKFHQQNCYLDFNIVDMTFDNVLSVFKMIANEENSNLQVMCSSTDVEKENFLLKNGFKKVRQCYEVGVTLEDLIHTEQFSELVLIANKGTVIYQDCCELLFNYYVETHKAINPLTVTFDAFVLDLPEQVFYVMAQDKIIHVAFVENNEIAYVSSINKMTFKNFIIYVVRQLFLSYDVIYFESDDVDWAAMQLKNLFNIKNDESYNTWLFKNIK